MKMKLKVELYICGPDRKNGCTLEVVEINRIVLVPETIMILGAETLSDCVYLSQKDYVMNDTHFTKLYQELLKALKDENVHDAEIYLLDNNAEENEKYEWLHGLNGAGGLKPYLMMSTTRGLESVLAY